MFNPGSGMLILVKKVSSTNNRRGVACDCTCTALLTRTRLIHGVDSHRRRLGEALWCLDIFAGEPRENVQTPDRC